MVYGNGTEKGIDVYRNTIFLHRLKVSTEIFMLWKVWGKIELISEILVK